MTPLSEDLIREVVDDLQDNLELTLGYEHWSPEQCDERMQAIRERVELARLILKERRRIE